MLSPAIRNMSHRPVQLTSSSKSVHLFVITVLRVQRPDIRTSCVVFVALSTEAIQRSPTEDRPRVSRDADSTAQDATECEPLQKAFTRRQTTPGWSSVSLCQPRQGETGTVRVRHTSTSGRLSSGLHPACLRHTVLRVRGVKWSLRSINNIGGKTTRTRTRQGRHIAEARPQKAAF